LDASGDEMVAGREQAEECHVVALGAAGGEDDLGGAAVEQRGNRLARSVHRGACTLARLMDDAVAKAKEVKAAWPYAWVEGVDYPHKQERGTVTGQMVLDEQQDENRRE